jgi:hypothetical protein
MALKWCGVTKLWREKDRAWVRTPLTVGLKGAEFHGKRARTTRGTRDGRAQGKAALYQEWPNWKNGQKGKIGGKAWESNPPGTGFQPLSNFEVRRGGVFVSIPLCLSALIFRVIWARLVFRSCLGPSCA